MGLRRVNEEGGMGRHLHVGPVLPNACTQNGLVRRPDVGQRGGPFQVKKYASLGGYIEWTVVVRCAQGKTTCPPLLPLTQPTQREQSARFIALPLAPYRVSVPPCMLILPEPCPLETVHAQTLRNSSCIGTSRQVAPAYRATRNHTHEGESRWRREPHR